jgi:hypothetical protein
VRRVRRHTESNNLILLILLLESKRVVTVIAVDNKQTMLSTSTLLCIPVKVLQPLKTKLVRSLAVLRDCDNLVVR